MFIRARVEQTMSFVLGGPGGHIARTGNATGDKGSWPQSIPGAGITRGGTEDDSQGTKDWIHASCEACTRRSGGLQVISSHVDRHGRSTRYAAQTCQLHGDTEAIGATRAWRISKASHGGLQRSTFVGDPHPKVMSAGFGVSEVVTRESSGAPAECHPANQHACRRSVSYS